MRNLTKLQLACAVVLAIFCAGFASAFNTSHYATTSQLATGKWVKISIPETGMYELTYDELREMGFNNPAKVSVYGFGGGKISEVLTSSIPDDLKRVPILRNNDKICFYGVGPVTFSLADYSTQPRYTRTFNPYSLTGNYFLSEVELADLLPTKKAKVTVNNPVNTPTSLSYCYHEREMISVGGTGKEMLGENFISGNFRADYYMPEIADSSIVVYTSIAAITPVISYATAVFHSGGSVDTTSFSLASSRIYPLGSTTTSSTTLYNLAAPYAKLKLSSPAEHGQFEPYLRLTDPSKISEMARLDYFILTYKRYNVINEDENNQLLMGFAATRGNERFMLPNATSNTVVWCVNSPSNPTEVYTYTYNDETGHGLEFFSTATTISHYVAFDPTKTMKKITGYEEVPNQNLHGMPVPDLLIITDKMFHEQAQRVADLHTAVDGIDVAVVDQDQIFNEFSSGTRDAMAYRLLCKMFYDRDNTKFKNLLLFGTGTFDNRELMGAHPGNLLTYQSDNSNFENYSYTCDDFFGFLDDSSGSNVANDKLRIGVGRITCADVEEAKSDVDKLIEYYANPDYGVWRNNTMVASDSYDSGDYLYQGECYKNMIDNELNTGMHVTTVHDSQYPRSATETGVEEEKKTAVEGKQLWSNVSKGGVYFSTYVGHAGPVSFTKKNRMWTTGDVARTSYNHWPIMSTACCDVAHFDGDTRGIAELMFHKRDGGAIALLASTRMVFANDNNVLNKNFIKALFSYEKNGYMPTLGEAYMQSKLGFTASNINKMCFTLLGDPAIKINYPISRFQIMELNGADMTDSTDMAMLRPLRKFELVAHVLDADGNLDTSFNGDATVTLYDKEELFTTLASTGSYININAKIYFNRDKLTELDGRVENGVFTASVIVPETPKAKNEMVLMRVYAHKDNTDYMVNGFTKNIKMLAYDANMAIHDTENPVITNMYINNEDLFNYGATVGTTSMLYITATDDQGINFHNTVDRCMRLVLDGGRPSYNDITCYATTTNEGKTVNVEFPLNNLSEGLHTLTYTVFDMVGNSAERTITFIVGQTGVVELTADALPAYSGQEVNFNLETELSNTPEMVLRVTDATGKLIWMKNTNTFPVTWNMRDMDGNLVPGGLYRYFGTYNDGVNYGGTSINKLIVLDPLKTAN